MKINPVLNTYFTINVPNQGISQRNTSFGRSCSDTFTRTWSEAPEDRIKRLYENKNYEGFNNSLKRTDSRTMVQTLVEMSPNSEELPIVHMGKESIKNFMRHSDYGTFLRLVFAENSQGANFFQVGNPSRIEQVAGYMNHEDFVWGLQKADYSDSNAFHAAAGNPQRQKVFYKRLSNEEILHLSTRKNEQGVTAFSLYKGEEFKNLVKRFDEKELLYAVQSSEAEGNTYFNYLEAPELEMLCSRMNPDDVKKFAVKRNDLMETPLQTQTPEGAAVLLKYLDK